MHMWQVNDGSGSIAMRDVSCQGGDTRLEDCGRNGWWDATDCPHSWDVGVFCDDSQNAASRDDSKCCSRLFNQETND